MGVMRRCLNMCLDLGLCKLFSCEAILALCVMLCGDQAALVTESSAWGLRNFYKVN